MEKEVTRKIKMTKITYIIILLGAIVLFSVRIGELFSPVSVEATISGGIAGISETYKVYRDGFNYYVELSVGRSARKPAKYRITRSEFYRCVNKKLDTDKELNKLKNQKRGTVMDGFNYRATAKYWWGAKKDIEDDPYFTEIYNLYMYKAAISHDSHEEEKTIEYYRTINSWADLCYKYRVKNSELMMYRLNNSVETKGEKQWSVDSTYLKYIGPNSDRTVDEILRGNLCIKKGIVDFEDILGKNDLVKYIAYLSTKGKIDKDDSNVNIREVRLMGLRLKNKLKVLKDQTIYGTAGVLIQNSDYKFANGVTSKTLRKGDDILHIYTNSSYKKGYAVLFRTNDFVSSELLLTEMDRTVKGKTNYFSFVNLYVLVRVIIFAILEYAVFMYVGKKRNGEMKEEINNLL